MSINPNMRRLNKHIQGLLNKNRPERYLVNKHVNDDSEDSEYADVAGTEWLDSVAEQVTKLDIPADVMRQYAARTLVGQQERALTRWGNRYIREVAAGRGELPEGLPDDYDMSPVAVVYRVPDKTSGLFIVHEVRVIFWAMTAEDFRTFATNERRRAAKDFKTRNDTCDGADWLADQMELTGAVNFRAWVQSL